LRRRETELAFGTPLPRDHANAESIIPLRAYESLLSRMPAKRKVTSAGGKRNWLLELPFPGIMRTQRA
ncbi:MAG: hypothetical protein PHN30_04195, partial [Bacteroidales bacterium]|nr:hypothetical protein [Bacteroidales bacterium]MDD3810989.1 hypothetical protein [Bacteroidales bacterium]